MKGDLALSLKIFLSWILLLVFYILLGGILFGGLGNINFLSLANWDGRHFLDISINGYTNNTQYAFFPLYPIAINLVSKLSNLGPLYSALIINFLASFGIIFLFIKFLKDSGFNNSLRTVIFFLIFPVSFYFICTYSETLFLLLSLLTFSFLQEKKFKTAALFAALSSVTRIVGIAVILAFLFEIFTSKLTLKEKVLNTLISFAGLFLYCLFLFIQTGNPFYFLTSELTWGRYILVPGYNFYTSLYYLSAEGIRPENFTIFTDILFTIFGIGMGIKVLKSLKPSLSIYTWGCLLIPLMTAILLSMPRFLIVIFPLFIVFAKIKNKLFLINMVIIFLVLQFLFFNFYLRNIWVS